MRTVIVVGGLLRRRVSEYRLRIPAPKPSDPEMTGAGAIGVRAPHPDPRKLEGKLRALRSP